ncbi:hypothetical protein [Acinetobacter sp. MD2(2019)]|uniref:hypothetical protein n=1 Tax=Acinetobacter sp. MD2(2019) TaxID=2605273 RepID=UPI002D1F99D3|nr:hypothetical protein [Acinetobacter sp. MD2(2019)]MEB3752945.1 hypothetical protein [Acinetobacter sp. MD2(2019)]
MWSVLDNFREDTLAVSVYVIGATIVLLAWYFMTKPYPKFCFVSTLIAFACIVTPTVSEGTNASLAPAIFGLLFGVLTHDKQLIQLNLGSILFVIGLGCVVGFCWSKWNKRASVTRNSTPL